MYSHVLALYGNGTLKSVLYREVVPFSEGSLSEVSLYIFVIRQDPEPSLS